MRDASGITAQLDTNLDFLLDVSGVFEIDKIQISFCAFIIWNIPYYQRISRTSEISRQYGLLKAKFVSEASKNLKSRLANKKNLIG